MGCATCGNSKDGVPSGCGSKGHCLTGGCNKMNTFDWLSNMDIYDPAPYNIVEVSFHKGSRKDFFQIQLGRFDTGDMVVVDTGSGYDIGKISLSGELVRLQIRKKKIPKDRLFRKVIRGANQRDLEKLDEARRSEKEILVRSRAIVNTLDLRMKIGDIEFQGDKRKITFYYTADGRVDFRELVRHYAKEFRVKIEMRQIGSRQESARIGGIGSCGRELCCSTWLSDFRSVSTAAARYQNIAINQTKLSGQCGRLKCCLNYELDSYMEALATFPKRVDYIKTQKGEAHLIKTDIFKGIMYYAYTDPKLRGPMVRVPKDRVAEIKEMNKRKEYPEELLEAAPIAEIDAEITFADVTGVIELPAEKRRKKKRRKGNNSRSRGGKSRNNKPNNKQSKDKKSKDNQSKNAPSKNKSKNTPTDAKWDEKPSKSGTPNQSSGKSKKKRYYKKPKKKE